MNLKKFSKVIKQVEDDLKIVKKEAGVKDDDDTNQDTVDSSDQDTPDDGSDSSPFPPKKKSDKGKKDSKSDDSDGKSGSKDSKSPFPPKKSADDDATNVPADTGGDDSKPVGKFPPKNDVSDDNEDEKVVSKDGDKGETTDSDGKKSSHPKTKTKSAGDDNSDDEQSDSDVFQSKDGGVDDSGEKPDQSDSEDDDGTDKKKEDDDSDNSPDSDKTKADDEEDSEKDDDKEKDQGLDGNNPEDNDEVEDEKDDDNEVDIGPVPGNTTLSGKPKDTIIVNPDLDDENREKTAKSKTDAPGKTDATGNQEPDKSKKFQSGTDEDGEEDDGDENQQDKDGKPFGNKQKGQQTSDDNEEDDGEQPDNDDNADDSDSKQSGRFGNKKPKPNVAADDGNEDDTADTNGNDDNKANLKNKAKPKKDKKKFPVKEAFITFGRMNPPTIAHEMLVNKLKELAEHNNGDVIVFLSQNSGTAENPIAYSEKVEYAKKAFGNVVYEGTDAPNIVAALKTMTGKYDKVTIMVGSDREDEFSRIVNVYNGKDFTFESLNVVSAGNRQGVEIMENVSAAKVRTFAIVKAYDKVAELLPENIKHLAEEISLHCSTKYRSMANTLRDMELANVDIKKHR